MTSYYKLKRASCDLTRVAEHSNKKKAAPGWALLGPTIQHPSGWGLGTSAQLETPKPVLI